MAPRTKGEPCLSHPCSQGFGFALRPATNDRPQGMNNAESGRPTRRGRDADVTLAVASLSRLEARDLRHDSEAATAPDPSHGARRPRTPLRFPGPRSPARVRWRVR